MFWNILKFFVTLVKVILLIIVAVIWIYCVQKLLMNFGGFPLLFFGFLGINAVGMITFLKGVK